MSFKYTKPKIVKTEIVDGVERTFYEANFLVPMQMFNDVPTKLDKETKKAVKLLMLDSIKQSFQQMEKRLFEYMQGYNEFVKNKK